MPIVTEIMNVRDIEGLFEDVDVIQVGARKILQNF